MAVPACGEPVTSQGVYEQPLYALGGWITPFPLAADVQSPTVGVVWVDPAQLRDDLAASHVQFEGSQDGTFNLKFFAAPLEALRRYPGDVPGEIETSFAFGEVVLFDDRDGDGHFAVTPRTAGSTIVAPDMYIGAARRHVVIYVEKSFDGTGTRFPELSSVIALSPGYHLAAVTCTTLGYPGASPITNPREEVDILAIEPPSPTLPFTRACLRSHPL
jgi:hypothetical protein